tara:strand:+ start:1163 stop:1642 length:480 start_codon:yes stop_codon:yes gene_type:complete
MAYRKYAYYNHGNKVAIVEKEISSKGGNLAVAHCTIGGYDTKDTCEAAGGQWIPSSSGIGANTYEKYISPRDSIEDGLEIEFTYSVGASIADESDDLDITSYQAKAIVYYLKAKMAEDSGNIEMREYFMRLFKKQIEKERSGRSRGPYVAMGNSNMRNR